MAADTEPVVAREIGFQGADVTALLPQLGERMLDGPPGLWRESAGILDDQS